MNTFVTNVKLQPRQRLSGSPTIMSARIRNGITKTLDLSHLGFRVPVRLIAIVAASVSSSSIGICSLPMIGHRSWKRQTDIHRKPTVTYMSKSGFRRRFFAGKWRRFEAVCVGIYLDIQVSE